MAVMEVNSESSDLLNDRGSYQTSNHPVYYINTPLRKNKVSFFFYTIPRNLEFEERN